MMQIDVNDLRDKFEPGTVKTERSFEGAALASIAISLKRLADAAEKFQPLRQTYPSR